MWSVGDDGTVGEVQGWQPEDVNGPRAALPGGSSESEQHGSAEPQGRKAAGIHARNSIQDHSAVLSAPGARHARMNHPRRDRDRASTPGNAATGANMPSPRPQPICYPPSVPLHWPARRGAL